MHFASHTNIVLCYVYMYGNDAPLECITLPCDHFGILALGG
jgi:hypothetical protein